MRLFIGTVIIAVALGVTGCATQAPAYDPAPIVPVATSAADDSASDPAPADPPAPVVDEYVYQVTANAQGASITWTDGSASQQQNTAARLPWRTKEPGGGFAYEILAQDLHGTSITCTISRNGVVVKTVTSKGKYAIAMCVYSPTR